MHDPYNIKNVFGQMDEDTKNEKKAKAIKNNY
jgi:hypothetical protein